jgi:hypothetical protein
MKIDFVLIADAVEAVNGKLYVMGGCWHTHSARSYPANVRVGVAISLELQPSDMERPHDVSIRIIDEKSQSILAEVQGKLEISSPHKSNALVAINNSVRLEASGKYSVHVKADDISARPVTFESTLSIHS